MRVKMKLTTLVFLATGVVMTVALPGQSTTHVYQSTSAVIANPERGWYDDYYSHAGGKTLGTTYKLLKAKEMKENRENDKITLILRLFYLHEFLEEDAVSQEYLDRMQSDFDSVRAAGVKCIIRFAYSASQSAAVWDATPDKVFSHIESLAGVLTANGDVIAGAQAGFIGAWGEWYYTKNFAGFSFKPDETDQQNRRTVVEKLLDALPGHVSVAGRTPAIMQNIAGTTDPLTESEAFDGSYKSRTGHHNDCFLADASDYGTYTNLEEDLAYLHETTQYTITGGETCDASNPTSDCVNGLPRMAELHWTYLNRDYNRDVYDKWAGQGCYDEINISMGYRIRLVSATLSDSVSPGADMHLSLTLQNNGYAAPTLYKPIQVVLTHTTSGEQLTLDYHGTRDDIRFWLPGEILTEGSVVIPAELEDGNYSVALRLADKDPGLAQNTAYSIQLANAGTWDEQQGINLLNHMVVIGAGGEGALPLAPIDLEASTVSDTEIALTWTGESGNETGFEIMRSRGESDTWETLVTLEADAASYTDTLALKGTMYSYIIRAINAYGASAWSDSATATTLGVSASVPAVPSFEVYPNPLFGGDLTLRFPDNATRQVVITSASGAHIFSASTSESTLTVRGNLFSQGIHLLTITEDHKKTGMKLLVL
ncbi:MAG: DUF4832 domain-containing protein [Bacteroidota bacterium]